MMFKTFLQDETGAITTDWVTLTSALIIFAIIVIFALFSDGITPLTGSINAQIETGSQEFCAPIASTVTGGTTECYEISN
ncbi:MAG TPA: pilus assembly protein [Thermohalobaculum sp.]|nr:pilus assembly protein [Thermohalobaculum sp.]